MGKTGTILRVVCSFLKWLPLEELKWNHPLNFYIYTHNYVLSFHNLRHRQSLRTPHSSSHILGADI